jgi:hypothetical protein
MTENYSCQFLRMSECLFGFYLLGKFEAENTEKESRNVMRCTDESLES